MIPYLSLAQGIVSAVTKGVDLYKDYKRDQQTAEKIRLENEKETEQIIEDMRDVTGSDADSLYKSANNRRKKRGLSWTKKD